MKAGSRSERRLHGNSHRPKNPEQPLRGHLASLDCKPGHRSKQEEVSLELSLRTRQLREREQGRRRRNPEIAKVPLHLTNATLGRFSRRGLPNARFSGPATAQTCFGSKSLKLMDRTGRKATQAISAAPCQQAVREFGMQQEFICPNPLRRNSPDLKAKSPGILGACFRKQTGFHHLGRHLIPGLPGQMAGASMRCG